MVILVYGYLVLGGYLIYGEWKIPVTIVASNRYIVIGEHRERYPERVRGSYIMNGRDY